MVMQLEGTISQSNTDRFKSITVALSSFSPRPLPKLTQVAFPWDGGQDGSLEWPSFCQNGRTFRWSTYASKSIQMETLGWGKEDCGEQSRHEHAYFIG